MSQLSQSSFAGVTRSQPADMFPKKNQAIVIPSSDDLTTSDYILAVAKIVQPRNIKFASRISNNRVCLYLSSVDHVDNIVNNYNPIEIEGQRLNVRRLVSPARRLILSNVCPSVPHKILEDALKNIGAQPVSPISFLKASYISDEFSHIMSFRRQLYIKPDNDLQLPSSILVNYEDISYRVFTSYDEVVCFTCKKKGHFSKQCPQLSKETTAHESESNQTQTVSLTPNDQNLGSTSSHSLDRSEDMELTPDKEHQDNTSRKRTATTLGSLSPTSLIDLDPLLSPKEGCRNNSPIRSQRQNTGSNNTKKLKRSDSSNSEPPPLDEMLEPARKYFDENSSPVQFETIRHFLENAFGNPDPYSLAKTYSVSIDNLLECLQGLYPLFTHRAIKNRCTRIMTKIKRQVNRETPAITDTSLIFN